MKVGSKYVWLWIAIESMKKQILQVDISFERTMLIVPVSVLCCIIDKHIWQASGFNSRRWNLVSTASMWILKTEISVCIPL